MAITEDLVRISGQGHEILKRVGNGSLEASDVRKALQAVIEGRFSITDLILGRFTSPEQQVANVREWVGHFFSKEQIDEVAAAVPEFAWDHPLVPLTLCWTMNHLQQSVDAKLTIMRAVYGRDKVSVSDNLRTDPDSLKLVDGAPKFTPNHLWWEVVDLGSIRNTAPDKVDPALAAGTQMFDIACQHPAAVAKHNGGSDPYWDVPGLRVNVPGYDGWSYCPYIYGYSDGDASVRVYWAGNGDPCYAEPVVIRES